MDEEDNLQWQEEFKVRVSSDFDRLVAFATEINKTRDSSPKRETDMMGSQQYTDFRSRTRIDESGKMKTEKSHVYPADMTNEKQNRMLIDEQSRMTKHMENQ